MSRGRKALIVMSSQSRIGGENGRETGAYLPEVAHAWQVFAAAGCAVDLASTRGGAPPLEAVNRGDPAQAAFLDDVAMRPKLDDTLPVHLVEADSYDLVFLAGGHAAVVDFPDNRHLGSLVGGVYDHGGVVASVCHGAAGLVNVALAGNYLVDGKSVSCFTDDEERAVGMSRKVPFLLSEKLTERGAVYTPGPSFIPHVVSDGRLVTGQNPPSATMVAEQALALVPVPRHATEPPGRSFHGQGSGVCAEDHICDQ